MNSALKEMATRSLALLAVVALLASAIGPMLDHHFAERHPAHGHLYLSAVDGEHTHPFEHTHIHYDAMYAPAPGDAGIVFFAPYDGMGHAHTDIATPIVTASPRFDADGDLLLRKGSDAVSVLRGITVAPLRQPPRV